MAHSRTHILAPFRVLGLHCDNVPVALQRLGNTYFAATSVERTFQVYNCDRLTVVAVGGHHEAPITAIASHNQLTFTAAGPTIYVWHRSKVVGVLQGHHRAVTQLLVFGEHLISASEDHTIKVWDFRHHKLHQTIEFEEYFNVSAILHPDTYLNKILVGSREGALQLWNIRTNQMVYNFKNFGSPITALQQSPAVDVVAIGLEDGRIILHNIRLDKTLFTFKQEEGAVTSISFRSDGFNQMATGSKLGTVALWDLDKQRLIYLMRNVHHGGVWTMCFFAGEPLMFTSGADNAIKIWIFDQSDGSGRLLRSRAGHSAPPQKIRFYATSSLILSAARDKSFRLFSTVRDQRSREFSQGRLESQARKLHNAREQDLKLPPIVSFDACQVRQRDWDNIVTCHNGSNNAHTWRKENFVLGKHSLRSTDNRGAQPITAVCMSACGNFAFIGARSGWIDQFNIQSGQHRRCFRDTKSGNNHTAAITGLAVDAMNRMLISASLDGTLRFWSFKDGSLIKSLDLEAPITQIELQRESGLLAVVCDDLVLRVYDVETQVLVRRLQGHTSLITDVTFSGDARWIASASGDGHLRVWDLPSGHCIDWVKMHSPITSLSFSPRSDFLATTHVDSRGIFLWANQNYFSNLFLRPVQPTETEPDEITMPSLSAGLDTGIGGSDEESSSSEESDKEDNTLEMSPEEADADADQLSAELITLSKTARSKWRTLVNLDVIQERNKPQKAPEAPKAAPFLLPTLPGVEPKFVATADETIEDPNSKIINMSSMRPKTKFILALEKVFDDESELEGQTADFAEVIKMLEAMSPSAIDFELRSLSLENDCHEFKLFLKFALAAIRSNGNFEIIESVLNVFLKTQGDTIARNPSLQSLAREVRQEQTHSWQRLQDLLHQNLCLISYFSNLQT